MRAVTYIALLIVVLSCSTSNDPPNAPGVSGKLKSVTMMNAIDTGTNTYEYDDRNRLIKVRSPLVVDTPGQISGEVSYMYHGTEELPYKSISVSTLSSGTYMDYSLFYYDEQKRPVRQEGFRDGAIWFKNLYSYVMPNSVIIHEYGMVKNVDTELRLLHRDSITLDVNNNPISRHNTLTGPGNESVRHYTFDDKKSPYGSIGFFKYGLLLRYDGATYLGSTNNLLTLNSYYKNNLTMSIENTYEYSSNGYVVKATQKNTYQPQNLITTFHLTFEYY